MSTGNTTRRVRHPGNQILNALKSAHELQQSKAKQATQHASRSAAAPRASERDAILLERLDLDEHILHQRAL